MLAATIAALPFKIPVAHLHGGESTEGLIDEAIRHSITKMSHIHFTSTEFYRERVMRMGENPKLVYNTGSVSLDNLESEASLSKDQLEKELDFKLEEKCLLATLHPVTLEFENTRWHAQQWLKAIACANIQTIVTYPNADTHGSIIIEEIKKAAAENKNIKIVMNLGKKRYFSMMKYCQAMVGNSSSGIIESASFKLPVINIGNRQRGRIHSFNVIDVGHSYEEIEMGIKTALSSEFKESLKDLKNPYVNGIASKKMVDILETVPLNLQLIEKKFYDGL